MLDFCNEMVSFKVLLFSKQILKQIVDLVKAKIYQNDSQSVYEQRIMVVRLFPILLEDSEFEQMDILFIVFSPFIERFSHLLSVNDCDWIQDAARSMQSCFGLDFKSNVDNETRYEAIHSILQTCSDSLVFNNWASVLILDILETRIYSALDIIEKYVHLMTRERLWIIQRLRYFRNFLQKCYFFG